jgi:hypothetical protein
VRFVRFFRRAAAPGTRRYAAEGTAAETVTVKSPLNDAKLRQELAELAAELQHPRKSSKFVTGMGFAAALLLAGAFIDEAINVAVGLHSSTWEAVEGEIVSEPVVSFAGAMLKRREVGIRYKYYVEPVTGLFQFFAFFVFDLGCRAKTTRTRTSRARDTLRKTRCLRRRARGC